MSQERLLPIRSTDHHETAQPVLRVLTPADLPIANRLVQAAGWNQTSRDWLRLLAYEPEGCFLASLQGRPVGTVTTTCYGSELGWIGMMLVDPDYRRRGIATALMQHSLSYLRRAGVSWVQLDATPQGRPLYERLGFQLQWEFHRWQRHAEAEGEAPLQPPRVQSSSRTGLDQHAGLDHVAFGANRSRWLQRLAEDSRVLSTPDGFAMIRPGRLATYLGPVTAQNAEAAEAMIRRLIEPVRGPIFWDVPECNAEAQQLAQRLDFQPLRPLLRMAIGEPATQPAINLQFALADPAVG